MKKKMRVDGGLGRARNSIDCVDDWRNEMPSVLETVHGHRTNVSPLASRAGEWIERERGRLRCGGDKQNGARLFHDMMDRRTDGQNDNDV